MNWPVVKATSEDLSFVLSWLKEMNENDEEGGGLHFSASHIAQFQDAGNMWVIRKGGKAVAFMAGGFDELDGITVVRSDMRRRGCAESLVQHAMDRMNHHDSSMAFIHFISSSREFWVGQGFTVCENLSAGDGFAYKMLPRAHSIDMSFPVVNVKIGFYVEVYSSGAEHRLIKEHFLRGVQTPDELVQLESRVAYFSGNRVANTDTVVKIEIDGQCLYFDKAKRLDAEAVCVGRWNDIFIDEISLWPSKFPKALHSF